ncbi:hypothetical protein A9G11_04250 [Gilliamella sp. wkB108]|uniref:SurA N-terminal domain-containing protein n=1 Tax=Gilliamella sp. wkB108 TaxID=3120256 RepID=UPI00080E72C8|nr:SurA N-terminal domain-containing protein [Gilliamella apicola]OCG23852.1 hypothetical protein A9G11_04250 [Gilliamella apicola]
MMETIRKAANHIVVKIIFAIIILCFIFTGIGFLGFGGGSNKNDEVNYVAKVDGEGISRKQFEAQANNIVANSYGDASFIKQLRRQVLTGQIDNFLSYKFSQSLKAIVSDEQVKDAIRADKVFFENGQFSNKKYTDLLAANNLNSDIYADALRSSLQQKQVINALIKTDFVLPVDSERTLLVDQTRKAYISSVTPSIVNLDDINISTEDEQKYYDEHQSEFFRKERVKFDYIINSKDNIAKTITVSDDEVQQEYDKNKSIYTFPAKNAYSVIFVTNKEKADDISKDLSSGENFDNIVKTVNQDNEISPYGKNGSLGWFAVDDTLPQAFKDADLKKIGQISKPIAVEGGYLIIKLDDTQKAKSMDFDYIKYQITEKLYKQRLQHAFEVVEDKIKVNLNNPSLSLEEVAKKSDLELYHSAWSYYRDSGTILRYPEVSDLVFSNEMVVDGKATGKISDIIPVGNDSDMYDFVIQVVDYRPDGIAPFEEVKDEINKKLHYEIASDRFKSTVDEILKELNTSGESNQLHFAIQYKLNRNSKEFEKPIIDTVFDLIPSANRKDVYGVTYVNDDKEAYVIALNDVVTPDKVRDISSELTPTFIDTTHYYLIMDIRSKAKIEIMPNSNL